MKKNITLIIVIFTIFSSNPEVAFTNIFRKYLTYAAGIECEHDTISWANIKNVITDSHKKKWIKTEIMIPTTRVGIIIGGHLQQLLNTRINVGFTGGLSIHPFSSNAKSSSFEILYNSQVDDDKTITYTVNLCLLKIGQIGIGVKEKIGAKEKSNSFLTPKIAISTGIFF